MTEMVERVAHEMYVTWSTYWSDQGTAFATWPNLTDAEKGEYLRMAHAAIAAMREPTKAMIEAGSDRFSDCWSLEPGDGLDEDPPEPVWQAMIDAALAPAKQE